MKLSNRTTIRLTNFGTTAMSGMGTPQWSPDGAKLLFTFCSCLVLADGAHVDVIKADGSELQPQYFTKLIVEPA
jgi:Tol biopolymer transport system component